MSSEQDDETQSGTPLQMFVLSYLRGLKSKQTSSLEQNSATNTPEGFVTLGDLIDSLPSSMKPEGSTAVEEVYKQLTSLEEWRLLTQKKASDLKSCSFSITYDGKLAIKLILARVPRIIEDAVQRDSPDIRESVIYLNAKVKEMERDLKRYTSLTKDSPSASTVINITSSNITNSPFQVESKDSSQSITQINESKSTDLKEIVTELRQILSHPQIPLERKQELEAEVRTIESQLSSPKPKTRVIKETVLSTRDIVESLSGIVVGTSLIITRINSWLSGIP